MENKPLSHKELLSAVTTTTGLEAATVETVTDAYLGEVTKNLTEGNSVTLKGLGAMRIKDRAERSGRNPSTGEAITIPACKVAFFKPGKSLKDAINAVNK